MENGEALTRMCGIVAIVGKPVSCDGVQKAVEVQRHRGPDDKGVWVSPTARCILGHSRLSILDLSETGHQPMGDPSGRFWICFNGEIYNYLELREELRHDYIFRTQTDTEVLLAAYQKWGQACLDHLMGMFAFVLWDEVSGTLFAARDRFGIKPLYYAIEGKAHLVIASEIKALHAFDIPREFDPVTWSTYLSSGFYDHSPRTFWKGISSLPPGHAMLWSEGTAKIWQWYDLAKAAGQELDSRSEQDVAEEYFYLLEDSVRLRFRSDVPVGINMSGGLDSSILFAIVKKLLGHASKIRIFTFATGHPDYDETAWVQKMLKGTAFIHEVCLLKHEEIPELALKIQYYQDEPFGGFPTMAYSKTFERARQEGVIVLLDGQGLDEQWAGYEYYAVNGQQAEANGPVQGSRGFSVRPDCLTPGFAKLAAPFESSKPFQNRLQNLQYRDARYAKIPRALRFNDRISMMHNTELREPFLDHRLFELALRQPEQRKIFEGTHKWLLRRMAASLLPEDIFKSSKRPLQTPQREWLKGPLRNWAEERIKEALSCYGGIWFDRGQVLKAWEAFQKSVPDNSFYIWQWINLGLMVSANGKVKIAD